MPNCQRILVVMFGLFVSSVAAAQPSAALEIANSKQRPTWNKCDFFGDTFTKKPSN